MLIHLLEGLALITALALCLSLLAAQAVTGVPSHSANAAERADVVALLARAGCPDGAVIYDLGCGWGALVIALARAFPNARIRGIELSPFPYWVARLRTRRLPNVSLQRRDFLRVELADAWAVTCYLMPKPMPKLAAALDRTLKPGTPVVALSFWFRDRQAAAVREGPGLRGAAALYYWPARRAAAAQAQIQRPGHAPALDAGRAVEVGEGAREPMAKLVETNRQNIQDVRVRRHAQYL